MTPVNPEPIWLASRCAALRRRTACRPRDRATGFESDIVEEREAVDDLDDDPVGDRALGAGQFDSFENCAACLSGSALNS